jgi:hypothetical protein
MFAYEIIAYFKNNFGEVILINWHFSFGVSPYIYLALHLFDIS